MVQGGFLLLFDRAFLHSLSRSKDFPAVERDFSGR
jgi:hypothetical protein